MFHYFKTYHMNLGYMDDNWLELILIVFISSFIYNFFVLLYVEYFFKKILINIILCL